jgi:hypothetical protein
MQGAAIDTHYGQCAAGGVDQAGQTGSVWKGVFHSGEEDAGRAIEHQRNAQFREQACRQAAVVLDGPLFGSPAGERSSQHEIAGGQIAFGMSGRQRERVQEIGCARGGGQIEILVHHVSGAAEGFVRIEKSRGRLAELRSVEAENAARVCRCGHQRGFQKALKIDGEVIMGGAKIAPTLEQAGERAAMEKHQAVNERVSLQQ